MKRTGGLAPTLTLALMLAHAPAISARLTLALTPDPTRGGGALSPEGCYLEPGPVQGLLTTSSAGSTCHSGAFGPAARTGVIVGQIQESAELPASFTTEPLAEPFAIGGRATLGLYIANDEGSGDAYPPPEVLYGLEEIRSDGTAVSIASGRAMSAMGTYYRRRDGTFEVPAHTLAAGSRLRLNLTVSKPTSARLLFGDAWAADGNGVREVEQSYADAGIAFEDASEKSGGIAAGSPGPELLAALLALAWGRLNRASARTPSCSRRAP